MPRLPQLYPWLSAVASAFGGCLSPAQARTLAWFSFGMVLARSCAVTAVATQLADLLGQKRDTVKQRLREWYVEAGAKAGRHRRALPRGWTVVVLTDRGLYAKWLYQAIRRLGWHPFMRVNTRGTFRPHGEKQRRPLQSFVPEVGSQWEGAGEAFKDRPKRLRCT